MKNIYLLDKKEIKKELKEFNKTQIGKNLNIISIISMVAGFSLGLLMFISILEDILFNNNNEILELLNSIDISIYMITVILIYICYIIVYTSYLKFFKDYYNSKNKES